MEKLDYQERLLELEKLEEEKKQQVVEEALAKFNFFLHVTGYLSGCSFLLILGILMSSVLPYIFIPIGLWTIGLAYHWLYAFRPETAARLRARLHKLYDKVRGKGREK